jgi:arylsulfatase A-like enzyme
MVQKIENRRGTVIVMQIKISSWACLLFGIAALIASTSSSPANAQEGNGVNFVVVLVDDMRWDDFGAGGNPFIKTPNIDRVAAEGARFVNAFTATPLCSPSRASFLTGVHTHAHGIIDNTSRGGHELDTFPRRLQSEYDTAFIGKWHMGKDGTPRPGFDTWVSISGQGTNNDPELFIGDQRVQTEGHVTDVLTDHAVAFLEAKRSQPFLLYLSQKAVHPDPTVGLVEGGFIAADRHLGIYDDEPIDRLPSAGVPPRDKPALMRKFEGLPPLGFDTATSDTAIRDRLEMMSGVDESVGRLLDALKRSGELDDTVFIVTSDHGYFYGEHGLNAQRRLAYEESIRVPLVIRYPKLIEAGSILGQMAQSIDLAPTILELAGRHPDDSLHGRSLVPVMTGEASDWRPAILIEFFSDPDAYIRDTITRAEQGVSEFARVQDIGYKAVRTNRYKYIQYTRLKNMDELYDLAADPFEMTNLINSPSARGTLREMQSELSRLLDETSWQ